MIRNTWFMGKITAEEKTGSCQVNQVNQVNQATNVQSVLHRRHPTRNPSFHTFNRNYLVRISVSTSTLASNCSDTFWSRVTSMIWFVVFNQSHKLVLNEPINQKPIIGTSCLPLQSNNPWHSFFTWLMFGPRCLTLKWNRFLPTFIQVGMLK